MGLYLDGSMKLTVGIPVDNINNKNIKKPKKNKK